MRGRNSEKRPARICGVLGLGGGDDSSLGDSTPAAVHGIGGVGAGWKRGVGTDDGGDGSNLLTATWATENDDRERRERRHGEHRRR